MSDYSDILNMTWEDIPEPKLVPGGSWLLRCRNATFIPKKGEQDAKVLFFYEPKEPMDDVDAGEIEALGDYNVSENDLVAQFFINRSKDWVKVRNHIEKHGVEVTGNIPETLKSVKGSEVIAFVGTRTYTNSVGESVTDNTVTQFAPVS